MSNYAPIWWNAPNKITWATFQKLEVVDWPKDSYKVGDLSQNPPLPQIHQKIRALCHSHRWVSWNKFMPYFRQQIFMSCQVCPRNVLIWISWRPSVKIAEGAVWKIWVLLNRSLSKLECRTLELNVNLKICHHYVNFT